MHRIQCLVETRKDWRCSEKDLTPIRNAQATTSCIRLAVQSSIIYHRVVDKAGALSLVRGCTPRLVPARTNCQSGNWARPSAFAAATSFITGGPRDDRPGPAARRRGRAPRGPMNRETTLIGPWGGRSRPLRPPSAVRVRRPSAAGKDDENILSSGARRRCAQNDDLIRRSGVITLHPCTRRQHTVSKLQYCRVRFEKSSETEWPEEVSCLLWSRSIFASCCAEWRESYVSKRFRYISVRIFSAYIDWFPKVFHCESQQLILTNCSLSLPIL